MFITPAYAQSAGAPAGFDFLSLAPIILIFVVFYFLLIRPQQKRQKEHQAMVAGARRGDVVVTGGGLVGKVTKVIDDSEAEVEIADGVRVRVMKNTLMDVRTKAEPAKDD